MELLATLFSVLSLITCVLANVEKTIFLGPGPVDARIRRLALSGLSLDALTPANGTLRTQLPASFPSSENPRGTATWLLLDRLTPDQRYEVRVCWPATQPTAFTLETFPLSVVQDSPDLASSLRAYAASRPPAAPSIADSEGKHGSSIDGGDRPQPGSEGEAAPALLLRILAAADYFTTDARLMSQVPPVDADVILDPFLLNVLPRSIAGTAVYIVAVAAVSFLVARSVVSWLKGLVAAGAAYAPSTSSGREKKRQ